MKKFIAILCLLIGSLFITTAQQDSNYIDIVKKDTLTINVIADNSKQTIKDTQDISSQFTKIVGNQTVVNQSLSEVLSTLSTGIIAYTKEIEERNKSDGNVLINTFNYSTSEIVNIIKGERWINLITWILTLIYVMWVINMKIYIKKLSPNANLDTMQVLPLLLIQCTLSVLMAIFMFYLIQNVLTLLFNGQYYIIKELISLYS